jgi:hypothetical protein
VVTAEYVPRRSISPGIIIGSLLEDHSLLIKRNSQPYVLYGAVFNETRYYSGARQYAIHKLLLLDSPFSDQRRETVFSREADGWDKV